MANKKNVGILVFILVFVCAIGLIGCDIEAEYTLINNSSYTVSGSVGSNSFSVSSGRTTRVMGNAVAATITYSPSNLVNVSLGGGGFTATFTNKY